MTNIRDKRILIAVIVIALVVPWPTNEATAWNGEPWEEMSRDEIVALADEMIDSLWMPRNTIYNWTYDSRTTYYFGTVYRGIAYCLKTIPDDWDEFSLAVNTTSGGNTAYGNDCSGFASIAWRLPARYVTRCFEQDATTEGTFYCNVHGVWHEDCCYSLGPIGSCASAGLIIGDACVRSNGHIILYWKTENNGTVRSMEQTTWGEGRATRDRHWSWSQLSNYRPIRRRQLGGETLSVSLTAEPSSGTAPLSVDLTAEVSGTATGTINYTFYANRSDDGTNITPGYCFKIDARNLDGTGGTVIYQGSATGWTGGTTFTVYDVYNYTSAGTYTAKVIAERGSCQAEKRATITVNPPPTKIIGLSSNLTFGSVTVGTTAQRTLTIANSGNSGLTVSSISYPAGFSGAWSGSVPASGSQNVTVTFAPTAATSYGGTVTVNSDATSGTNTISASGTGIAAPTRIISLSGNLAFGNVQVGTTATQTLTIANSGNSGLTVSSISYPAGFSGAWSGSVPASGSQNVTVTFAPTAATSYGGTVTVNSDATSGTNTISASGTGTLPPVNISGYVRTSGGYGISGVTMSGWPGTAPVTDSSGYYSGAVSYGWSGTITPSKSGYTFSPTSKPYSNVTSDKSNENYTGALVCDFCGTNFGQPDGYVDVWDLMQFADHWHTSPGDNWDPKFDLTGPNFGDLDGYIDVWDLMVFADHWHEGQKP